ncbi:hypothetical protein K438DRAFT_1779080 [Mycena galopus ATCC 62051]|nr:hypothetical protein K438DRAFT_1779080 [Mycena galopus ATCC 62051]
MTAPAALSMATLWWCTPQMVQGTRMQQLLSLPIFVASHRYVDGSNRNCDGGTYPNHCSKIGLQGGRIHQCPLLVNQPNIKYIPRFFEHPTTETEHFNVSFVIPRNLTSAKDIISAIIFAKTIERRFSYMDYLDILLPSDLPNRSSLIKLYNGLMPTNYHRKLKEDFWSGKVRVMIVTDTAAYRFDMPNIRRVITTEVEPDFADSEQKWGHVGCDGQPAEGIAFAPLWVRKPPACTVPSTKTERDEERRAQLPEPTLAWYNPTPDFCSRHVSLHHNLELLPLGPIPTDCCGPIHDPDASLADLAFVRQWKRYFVGLAAETTATLRPNLDNLQIIMKGWEYFDECGSGLLKFLTLCMTEYNNIRGSQSAPQRWIQSATLLPAHMPAKPMKPKSTALVPAPVPAPPPQPVVRSARKRVPSAKAKSQKKKKSNKTPDTSDDSANEDDQGACEVDWKNDVELSTTMVALIGENAEIKQSLFPPCGPNASSQKDQSASSSPSIPELDSEDVLSKPISSSSSESGNPAGFDASEEVEAEEDSELEVMPMDSVSKQRMSRTRRCRKERRGMAESVIKLKKTAPRLSNNVTHGVVGTKDELLEWLVTYFEDTIEGKKRKRPDENDKENSQL